MKGQCYVKGQWERYTLQAKRRFVEDDANKRKTARKKGNRFLEVGASLQGRRERHRKEYGKNSCKKR